MTTNMAVVVEGFSDAAYLNALDRRIGNVSGQRRLFLTAAHELAHHVLNGNNDTGMSMVLDAVGQIVLHSGHLAPAITAAAFTADVTLLAADGPVYLDGAPPHLPLWNTKEFAGLPTDAWRETGQVAVRAGLRVTFRLSREAGSPPPDVRVALLRLLKTLLDIARSCLLQLVLLGRERSIVLARLGRPPGTVAFVILILAACRHYGRRSEPDDHASLFTRQKLVSMGSYALAC